EVDSYFTQPGIRTACITEVATAIQHTRPRIVIAHSLGSAVTYDALWTRPHPDSDLLLTVGSPLAMPDIVYPRLCSHPGIRCPAARGLGDGSMSATQATLSRSPVTESAGASSM